MFVESLKLSNFKNYENSGSNFCSGINIITGNNGQGKTNLLDAIYLLCMTKSNFQYSEKNLVRFGQDFFRVEAKFTVKDESQKVVCKFKTPGSKTIIIDDKEIKKYASYIGRFPVVIIAPGDIALIEEGSESRRRYMDVTICQGDQSYLNNLNKYNKLLKQRNSLLKLINNKHNDQNTLLGFYNEEMANLSVNIFNARKSFAKEIRDVYKMIYSEISGNVENVNFDYIADCDGDKESFLKLYEDNYKKDIILERTTHGIHKDDIEFTLHGQPVKRVGSQGQIKSTIFASKLSQYHWLKKHTATRPILLLDDIFDKLDHHRVSNLLKILDSQEYGQVFITDTYRERVISIIPELSKEFLSFQIDNGNITAYGK